MNSSKWAIFGLVTYIVAANGPSVSSAPHDTISSAEVERLEQGIGMAFDGIEGLTRRVDDLEKQNNSQKEDILVLRERVESLEGEIH